MTATLSIAGVFSLSGDTPTGVDLFRAVSQSGLWGIRTTGQFDLAAAAMEAKQFALSLEDTRYFRDAVLQPLTAGTMSIVQTRVHQQTFDQFDLRPLGSAQVLWCMVTNYLF